MKMNISIFDCFKRLISANIEMVSRMKTIICTFENAHIRIPWCLCIKLNEVIQIFAGFYHGAAKAIMRVD